MAYFTQTAHDCSPTGSSRLKNITITLYVKDCTGDVYITDVFLQGGSIATGWVSHVSEILWTLDG